MNVQNFDIKDYEWFEYSPEILYGKDKQGNEYRVSKYTNGNLVPVEKGTIWPNFFGAFYEQVEQLIAQGKARAARA